MKNKKNKKNQELLLKKQKKLEKNLIKDSFLTVEQLFGKYDTSYIGLDHEEVEERLDDYGRNTIEIKDNHPLLNRIKEAVINPFNIVLIIVAGITLLTDVIIVSNKDYSTFILIVSTIIISSAISFSQSTKSDNAARELKSMISNKMDIIRNNQLESIPVEEVVPGDIVKLSSGDMIPADVRFIEAKDLFIDQAALTGESAAVEKYATWTKQKDITDLSNIGFMGTDVVSGTATAIVLTTGENTYFGHMAKSLESVYQQNSFEKGVNSISKLLIRMMCIMLPVILVINLLTKSDIWDSVIFAITIAVGLTPEMLPVIMTSTLAKGAVMMSREKTIVKKLSAIQTFGQMDVLCTDKTGTLTEDRVILERYMDCFGNENRDILKQSFLNSYFQTGLKNLIDLAVINRAEIDGLGNLKNEYVSVDEIPFDFVRRRMSVLLKDNEGNETLITKGAVDEVISVCSKIEADGKSVKLTDELKKQAYETYEKYNSDGLRIIAVARKNEANSEKALSVIDESEMTLIGFIGFLDPPKASAREAIQALQHHGIKTVVLTGDSEGVAINVCKQVGIDVTNCLSGKDIDNFSDEELIGKLQNCYLLSKLSPIQKQRVVKLFQESGHTVGYMGDGINDSPALKQSDVGISVDTAVDIAKETADIILLEKDLNVLEKGVVNGRKTFTNVLKYIKMATSGNFGNTISVVIASLFLPFLPLLPIHILIQNLLNDLAQIGMPFDNVDNEYIQKPKKWNSDDIQRFMFFFGTISTILDILCFAVLWFIMKYDSMEKALLFQTGWFTFGIISQTVIIHMIRTDRFPFFRSRSSIQLILSTLLVVIATIMISFTDIAGILNLAKLPLDYLKWIVILIAIYILFVEVFKRVYVRIKKEWL